MPLIYRGAPPHGPGLTNKIRFWCFLQLFLLPGNRAGVRALRPRLPQRREGLDKGTIPGGSFPKGGHMQGLGLLASFQGA